MNRHLGEETDMGVRSIRISEDIERAMRYVAEKEKTEQAQSLRKLARLGFERYITKAYRDGEITLRDAARLLESGLGETLDMLRDAGVGGNVGAAEVLPGLEALREGSEQR